MIKTRVILILLATLLMVIIINPWLSKTNPSNSIIPQSIPNNDTAIGTPTNPSATYKAILERPIFNPSRRPLKQSLSNVSDQNNMDYLLGYKYRGVIKDDSKSVLLLERLGKLKQLSLGQVIKGWKLVKIEDGAIILSNGDSRINLLEVLNRSGKELKRETRWLPTSKEKE